VVACGLQKGRSLIKKIKQPVVLLLNLASGRFNSTKQSLKKIIYNIQGTPAYRSETHKRAEFKGSSIEILDENHVSAESSSSQIVTKT